MRHILIIVLLLSANTVYAYFTDDEVYCETEDAFHKLDVALDDNLDYFRTVPGMPGYYIIGRSSERPPEDHTFRNQDHVTIAKQLACLLKFDLSRVIITEEEPTDISCRRGEFFHSGALVYTTTSSDIDECLNNLM